MGYSKTMNYGDMAYIGGRYASGASIADCPVTTTAQTLQLGTINLPGDMVVKKVYLDFNVRGIRSTSGAANYIDMTGAITCTLVATSRISAYIVSGSFRCEGAEQAPGMYLYGRDDVGAAFQGGQNTTVTWVNARALGNNLILCDVQPVARVIMA